MVKFEEFGDKYHSYMVQVVTVKQNEYLMKKDGTVYMRKPGLPQLKDQEIVLEVQKQAKEDGGWSV